MSTVLGGNASPVTGPLTTTLQVPVRAGSTGDFDTNVTVQDVANLSGAPAVTVEFSTDANLTLAQNQYQAESITFTDSPTTLTAGRDVVFPSHFPTKWVKNNTAQTLTLKKSGQTGVAIVAGATAIVASGATDVVVGPGATANTPNVQSVSSAATVTPTFSNDVVEVTAQAAGLTLANPTGTAVDGWGMAIRIKDNGTSRTISYGTQYRAIGVTLPTATTVSKTTYLGMIYNAGATKWDVVAVTTEA